MDTSTSHEPPPVDQDGADKKGESDGQFKHTFRSGGAVQLAAKRWRKRAVHKEMGIEHLDAYMRHVGPARVPRKRNKVEAGDSAGEGVPGDGESGGAGGGGLSRSSTRGNATGGFGGAGSQPSDGAFLDEARGDDDESGEGESHYRIDALLDGSEIDRFDPYVIDPRSLFRNTWDICVVFLVLYNSISIPYTAGFNVEPSLGQTVFDYMVDVLFAVDIALNFYTAFYDDYGRLVAEKSKIRSNYMSTWFVVDLVASMPVEIIAIAIAGISSGSISGNIALLGVLKIPRLLRLGRILKFMEKFQYVNLWRIFRLLGLVILFSHWVACLWYYMCSMVADTPEDDLEIFAWCSEESDWTDAQRYFHAAHVAMLMLMGDGVHTVTVEQKIVAWAVVLFGGFLYAVIFGNVSVLVSDMDTGSRLFQSHMDAINEKIRYMQLPEDLSERIRQYHEYLFLRYRSTDINQTLLLDHLSPNLRDECLLFQHSAMVKKVPAFKLLPPGVILAIVRNLKPVVVMPGDVLLRKGERSPGLFFIAKGSVEILTTSVDEILHGMDDGPPKCEEDPAASRRRNSVLASGSSLHHMIGGRPRPSNFGSKHSYPTLPPLAGAEQPAGGTREQFPRNSLASAGHSICGVLESGGHFGEESLLSGNPVDHTIVSRTFCDLEVLNEAIFKLLSEEHMEIQVVFRSIPNA